MWSLNIQWMLRKMPQAKNKITARAQEDPLHPWLITDPLPLPQREPSILTFGILSSLAFLYLLPFICILKAWKSIFPFFELCINETILCVSFGVWPLLVFVRVIHVITGSGSFLIFITVRNDHSLSTVLKICSPALSPIILGCFCLTVLMPTTGTASSWMRLYTFLLWTFSNRHKSRGAVY